MPPARVSDKEVSVARNDKGIAADSRRSSDRSIAGAITSAVSLTFGILASGVTRMIPERLILPSTCARIG